MYAIKANITVTLVKIINTSDSKVSGTLTKEWLRNAKEVVEGKQETRKSVRNEVVRNRG